MKIITVHELKERLDKGEELTLIDVREQTEYDMANIGGNILPTSELENRFSEIPSNKTTVIMCRSGQRSANVVNWLEQNHGYSNLYNLEGGILAWARDIDPSLDVQ